MRLCRDGYIALDDADFREFFLREDGGIDRFIESLVKTQLVAIQDNKLVLTTISCQVVVTPDGAFAGEDHDGQLSAWMGEQLQALSAKKRGG